MARVMIRLDARESKALRELAQRECRDPRAQALLLLRRGLEDAGLLKAETATGERNTSAPHAQVQNHAPAR